MERGAKQTCYENVKSLSRYKEQKHPPDPLRIGRMLFLVRVFIRDLTNTTLIPTLNTHFILVPGNQPDICFC